MLAFTQLKGFLMMPSERFLLAHPDRFLEDILEHPQEDAPRLRYADWLEEQGNCLGELIRVQCRLARMPVNHLGILELEAREQKLLAEHGQEWAGDLADMVGWWTFRRGFVEEISLSVDKFLAGACSLYQRAPIQEVHVSDLSEQTEALAACPYLQRVTYLDLSNNLMRDHGLKQLAKSPHLAHVRGLNLSSCGIGDGGLMALAASPHLGDLHEVYLSDNRISSAGVRAFVHTILARRIQILHLRFNPIGVASADLLQRRLGDKVQL